MTNRTETELRLDTLKRNLGELSSGWEVGRGAAIAVGLIAFVILQVFLFLPAFTSVAGR